MAAYTRSKVLQVGKALVRRASTSAAAVESFPSYVTNAPATEVTTISNGLRVASEVRYKTIYL